MPTEEKLKLLNTLWESMEGDGIETEEAAHEGLKKITERPLVFARHKTTKLRR